MEVPTSQLRSAWFWIWLFLGFVGLLVLLVLSSLCRSAQRRSGLAASRAEAGARPLWDTPTTAAAAARELRCLLAKSVARAPVDDHDDPRDEERGSAAEENSPGLGEAVRRDGEEGPSGDRSHGAVGDGEDASHEES